MLKHRASVHDDVRIFRCPYCDANFSQRGLCDSHVKTVHDKKQAKYFCEHCGLPFSRKVNLNEHYEQAHPQYRSSLAPYHPGALSTVPTTENIGPEVGREYGIGRGDRMFVGDTVQPEQDPAGIFATVTRTSPAVGTTTPQAALPTLLHHLPLTGEFQRTKSDEENEQDPQGSRNG